MEPIDFVDFETDSDSFSEEESELLNVEVVKTDPSKLKAAIPFNYDAVASEKKPSAVIKNSTVFQKPSPKPKSANLAAKSENKQDKNVEQNPNVVRSNKLNLSKDQTTKDLKLKGKEICDKPAKSTSLPNPQKSVVPATTSNPKVKHVQSKQSGNNNAKSLKPIQFVKVASTSEDVPEKAKRSSSQSAKGIRQRLRRARKMEAALSAENASNDVEPEDLHKNREFSKPPSPSSIDITAHDCVCTTVYKTRYLPQKYMTCEKCGRRDHMTSYCHEKPKANEGSSSSQNRSVPKEIPTKATPSAAIKPISKWVPKSS